MAYSYPFVISINSSPLTSGFIISMFSTYCSIRPPSVESIWIVIGISNRTVPPSIRVHVYQAESDSGSCKKCVPRSPDISSVERVDITGVVIIETAVVIKNIHSSKTTDPSVAIVDIYTAYL